jgi:hypothetical protein
VKRLILAAAMAFLASISPAHAHASCTITQFTATGATASYDPFANAFTPVPIAVTVRGSADCQNRQVAFALGPTVKTPGTGTSSFSLSNDGDALQAQILGSNRAPMRITDKSAAFISPLVAGEIGRSGDLQGGMSLQLTLQPGQAVPPGGYGAQLDLFLCVLDAGGSCAPGNVFVAFLPVSVHVRQSLLLAALSAPYIEVGELRPGVTAAPLHFDAYANVKYELVLVSDNDFVLAPGGHGKPADGVPYVPLVSGTPVTAASTIHGDKGRRIDFPVPGNGGRRRHSFAVKILPFSDKPAGQYRDILTLCIRAQT